MSDRLHYRIEPAREDDLLGTLGAVLQWTRVPERTFTIEETGELRDALDQARGLDPADLRGAMRIVERGTAGPLDLLLLVHLLADRPDILDGRSPGGVRIRFAIDLPETNESAEVHLMVPLSARSVRFGDLRLEPEAALVLSVETSRPESASIALSTLSRELGPRVDRVNGVLRETGVQVGTEEREVRTGRERTPARPVRQSVAAA